MERWIAIVVVVCGCSTSAPMGTGDGGSDSGFDAGQTVDAGQDAGADSGPTCECQAADGQCCDGCHFRPSGFVCATSIVTGSNCMATANCGARIRIASVAVHDLACDGFSAACTYPAFNSDRVVNTDCEFPDGPSGAYLQYGRCSTAGGAHCVNGPSCGSEF